MYIDPYTWFYRHFTFFGDKMGGVTLLLQNIHYIAVCARSVASKHFCRLPIPKFPRKGFMAVSHLFPVVQYHPGLKRPELIKCDYSIGALPGVL